MAIAGAGHSDGQRCRWAKFRPGTSTTASARRLLRQVRFDLAILKKGLALPCERSGPQDELWEAHFLDHEQAAPPTAAGSGDQWFGRCARGQLPLPAEVSTPCDAVTLDTRI